MTLSNLTPKETVTAWQLTLELVQCMKDLSKNPDIEGMIKNAYALPKELEDKAENARKSISDNKAVLDENKKVLSQTEDLKKDLLFKQDNLDQTLKEIESRENQLAQKQKELDVNNETLKSSLRQLGQDKNIFNAEKQKNIEFKNSLDSREKALDEREEALKAKESQLKAIIGG